MSINVKQAIEMMGKTPVELVEVKVIKESLTAKPRFSGDEKLVIDMAREGIALIFNRDSNQLIQISLALTKENNPKYLFSNSLPTPLHNKMTQSELREKLGEPVISKPPRKILNKITGGVDQFLWSDDKQSISLLAYYTHSEQFEVKSFEFIFTDLINFPNN